MLLSTLLAVASTASCHSSQQAPLFFRRITVIGSEQDDRIRALDEAVAFWNDALASVGSPLRLQRGRTVDLPIPPEYFLAPARERRSPTAPPNGIETVEGDILVAMPRAHFVAFTLRMEDGRHFIGMRSTAPPLLDHPGVAENILAHELGHALGHGDRPDNLMCGAPAPCRPDRFASGGGRLFPLTTADRERLAASARAAHPHAQDDE